MYKLIKSLLYIGVFLCLSLPALAAEPINHGFSCESLLAQQNDPKQSWEQAQKAIEGLKSEIYGHEDVIKTQLSSALSRGFVYFYGGPGAAKTMIARKVFQAMLDSIPESEKRTFLIQFHKFVSEQKLTGFTVFDELLESGKTVINTSTSLVGDNFLFLIADEVEKANPATVTTLLSVMAERKAFHGSRVVDAILSSGVFTSNKSIGEYLDSYKEDRPSGEAVLDRMGQKIYVLHQQLSAMERLEMTQKQALIKQQKEAGEYEGVSPLPIFGLMELLDDIEIPDYILRDMEQLIGAVDGEITKAVNDSKEERDRGKRQSEKFPANQFSSRTSLRDINIFKANKLIEALWNGVSYDDFINNKDIDRNDLHLLSKSFVSGGLGGVVPESHDVSNFGEFTGVPIVHSEEGHGQGEEILSAELFPYSNRVTFQRPGATFSLKIHGDVKRDKSGKIKDIEMKSAYGMIFDISEEAKEAFIEHLNSTEEVNSVDIKSPRFQLHENFSLAMSSPTLDMRQKEQIKDIQQEVGSFTSNLNTQLGNKKSNKGIKYEDQLVNADMVNDFLQSSNEDEKAAYELAKASYNSLKSRYLESEHAIEAIFNGLVTDEHIYLFGPPGGAKTKMSREILQAVILSMNKEEASNLIQHMLSKSKNADTAELIKNTLAQLKDEDEKNYDIFIQQFHKFLPEGVLVGTPKLNHQMKYGEEDIEFSTSLVASKFVFAILDEADKANPQTLNALLSILNEREVFHGNDTFPAALRVAVITSNKVPSELLDSYLDDRSAAEAFTDRLFIKVYMFNKLTKGESLLELFKRFLTGGLGEDENLVIPVDVLKKLASRVEVDYLVKQTAMQIHDDFIARRLVVQEKSEMANRGNKREFPDYYVRGYTGTDRSIFKFDESYGARFIINQLKNGVPYDKLSFTFTMMDLDLIFQSMAYWVPVNFNVSTDDNVYVYSADTENIDAALSSGRLLRRSQYFLERSKEEIADFLSALNTKVRAVIEDNHNYTSQYKHLFPHLKITEEDLKDKEDKEEKSEE